MRKVLPSIYKGAVPVTQQSMVVNQYVCRCDCRYVGRTRQFSMLAKTRTQLHLAVLEAISIKTQTPILCR